MLPPEDGEQSVATYSLTGWDNFTQIVFISEDDYSDCLFDFNIILCMCLCFCNLHYRICDIIILKGIVSPVCFCNLHVIIKGENSAHFHSQLSPLSTAVTEREEEVLREKLKTLHTFTPQHTRPIFTWRRRDWWSTDSPIGSLDEAYCGL